MLILAQFCILFLLISSKVILSDRPNNVDGICDSIEESDDAWLASATECRVVIGSLDLRDVGIKHFNLYENICEITGYLRIHKAEGLVSLNDVLPRLSVIRGDKLIDNFSLIITRNRNLQSIGLSNLSFIGKGNIKIQDNSKLCDVEAINWTSISPNYSPEHSSIQISHANCTSSGGSTPFSAKKGITCDPQCFGGCSEDDPSQCNACVNFSFKQSCFSKCPNETLMYQEKFCVTHDDCINGFTENITHEPSFVPFNETCRTDCPNGFQKHLDERNKTTTCERVKDTRTVCSSITIRKLQDLNSLTNQGCQIINGFIDIQLNATDDEMCSGSDFEDNGYDKIFEIFKKIEEIEDFLKVTRSPFLQSLSLFPNLKLIRGNQLAEEKYSLILSENENLMHLWSTNPTVVVDHEKTFIDHAKKYLLVPKEPTNTVIVDIKTTLHIAMINWTLPLGLNVTKPLSYLYTLGYDFYSPAGRGCRKIIYKKIIHQSFVKTLSLFLPSSTSKKDNFYFELQLLDPENTTETVASSSLREFQLNPRSSNSGHNITSFDLISEGSTGIELKWRGEDFVQNNFDRYELRAFRVPYNVSKPYFHCKNLRTEVIDDKFSDSDRMLREEPNYELMDDAIKDLFLKELWNFPYASLDIRREFLQASVDNTKTSYNFTELESFAGYYFTIKACSGSGSDVWCSEPRLHYKATQRLKGLNRVENVTAVSNDPKSIEVGWQTKDRTNGPILYYEVVVAESSELKTRKCINYSEYRQHEMLKFPNLLPGAYSVSVSVTTLGEKSEAAHTKVSVESVQDSNVSWLLVVSMGVLLGLGALIFFNKKGKKAQLSKSIINFYYKSMIPMPDKEIELERERVVLGDELGKGNFGIVYRGKLKIIDGGFKSFIDVAVKTTNDLASWQEKAMLLREASRMKNLHSKHIVKLLGIASDDHKYFVVMELMENQDLKTFLVKHQTTSKMTISSDYNPFPMGANFPAIAHMAIQIADGMAFLAYKKFVHRDLAARNCMVSGDSIIKIGDFGMTRDVYFSDYYKMGCDRAVPIRWMAPESLNNRIFTCQSDVFSYGIVLWEIVTFAQQPYRNMTEKEVVEFICEGGTETRPDQNCSDKIYDLMTRCWKFNPGERITFEQIIEEFLDEAPGYFIEDSYYSLMSN